MTIEMFDPVSPHAAASPRVTPLPLWRPILPAPADAPVPRLKHPKLGEPAAAWRYIDAAGQLLGVVCRFNLGAGGKEIRSLVFAVHEKFGREWRWQGLPRPRPLYGLDRLAGRPDAPVIVCEGEKAADSAETLLPDYVAVTSPGGSKAAKAADWSPLKARRVTIWPDASAGRSLCPRCRRSAGEARIEQHRHHQAAIGQGRWMGCRRRSRRRDDGG
jgi:putative DNA primase/helicase